ncbi:hypothetical protein ACHHYP_01031 [Achlya hypogyna]|uniref:Uncharacterized protein n=1 Tax=Achlya hypogyna TaxID=1202772 RepID=A0A1V9Z9K6_ACHHY|nr:hypothetical protein ACHHYP_01031 [Achlya hypogyna]
MDEDDRLLAAIEAAAAYEAAAVASNNSLRAAFFKLTLARRNLPSDTLSDVAYREFFTADTGVVADASGLSIQKKLTWEVDGQEAVEPSLRQRKKAATDAKPAATPAASTLPTPIFWFAPLPSPELRAAQQHFIKALNDVVTTANAAAATQATLGAVVVESPK